MRSIDRNLEELPVCKKFKDIYCDDKNLSSNSSDCATKQTLLVQKHCRLEYLIEVRREALEFVV